jgi:predicted nucleic acid-binding protein
VTWLLDTDLMSDRFKPSPDPVLGEWIRQRESECAIAAVTLAEISRGVEILPSGKRQGRLRQKLRFLSQDYASRILPFEEGVALEWGRYCALCQAAGHKPPLLDSLIAATARYYGLQLATRNAKDFPLIDVVTP